MILELKNLLNVLETLNLFYLYFKLVIYDEGGWFCSLSGLIYSNNSGINNDND